MDKILKLTRAKDGQTVLVNTRFIIRCERDEDDEYTNVEILEHSDEEVKETPEEIYKMLSKRAVPTFKPETFKVEQKPLQALQEDEHMKRLAEHA